MNIQDALFKLDTLGGSSVLDKDLKEAVKAVALAINEIRNLCDVGALEQVSNIPAAVLALTTKACTAHAFTHTNIVATVATLEDRNAQLGEALQWLDSHAAAAPLEDETRIIGAALATAKEIYGATYFDARHKATSQLSKEEMARLCNNYADYRDNYCDGNPKITVHDFLKEYGLTKGYTKVDA